MPRHYNYALERLDDAIRRGNVTEPFVECVAVYRTKIHVIDASIDGFKVQKIKQADKRNKQVTVTATGSATIVNMKTSGIDASLTINVGFDIDPLERQRTVGVTLTDKKGRTFEWGESNEEARS